VSRWASFDEGTRRRTAAAAARDRDADLLYELLEAHLTLHGSRGARVSRHTLAAYRQALRLLLGAWQSENLLRPGAAAGTLWLREQEWRGLAPSTLRVRLAGVRALYTALRWSGATGADPFVDCRVSGSGTRVPRSPYPAAELNRLIAAAGPIDRVLILLGAHGGLRVSESLALTWEDVDLEHHRLVVQYGKGGRRRVVAVSESLAAALYDIRPNDQTLRVFAFGDPSRARRRIAAVCARAGVEYHASHPLRHSCGTRLYQETRDLYAVSEHLGHQSVETSRVYARMADDQIAQVVGAW
jgi:integrase/recombinase XerC